MGGCRCDQWEAQWQLSYTITAIFYGRHTAHQIGALQFQLQKILFITSQKCRDGQQTLISCTSFQILHLQLAVLFQTKSPMSTFSVSGDRILSHIMPRSADDDTVAKI